MGPAGLAWLASNGVWKPARHLAYLNRKLIDVSERRVKRLAVFMPPQHGKSTLISQAFPAWNLSEHPDDRIILTSYEANYAAEWGAAARDTFRDWAPVLTGNTLDENRGAANRWGVAGHEGRMYTAGVGGPITGKRANVLIIDDPVKNEEEALSPTDRKHKQSWFQSTALTRLAPDGAIVLIQTRWHREDLGGWLLSLEGGEPWEVVRMPAIAEEDDQLGRQPGEALWPEQYSVERLLLNKAVMTPNWWRALYQQDPQPEGGAEWPGDYFGAHIWFNDFPSDIVLRVLSLDPSKGKTDKVGDFSAFIDLALDKQGTFWVDADLARRPVSRNKKDSGPSIIADGLDLYAATRPQAFVIEVNGFQELLAPEFARQADERKIFGIPLYGITNTLPKPTRIRTIGPYLARRELLVRNTPGGRLLVQQLRDFPVGEHDDGPDALELAIRTMRFLLGERPQGEPQVIRV